MTKKLTHINDHGHAGMVDVGGKPVVRRRAVAEGLFCASPETLDLVMRGDLPKGEALSVARVAGVMAGKRCGALVPLCHPLPIEVLNVSFARTSPGVITVTAEAGITGRTGVEMEALTAVTVACLTLWDMTKAVDTDLRIQGVRVVEKRKG
jgi:cyclic pyranopterin phosphate synthase